jgi:hypothetical protein
LWPLPSRLGDVAGESSRPLAEAGGSGSLGRAELSIRAEDQLTVIAVGGDLGHCRAHLQAQDRGVVAESPDLIAIGRTLLVHAVGGYELVPEQERRFGPDEDVADPAPVAATPLRAKTVDLTTGDANGARKAPGCRMTQRLRVSTNTTIRTITMRSTPSTFSSAINMLERHGPAAIVAPPD